MWKEVDGSRTYFLYSDEGLVGEYDALGNELRTYGYMPDSTWTTDVLFQKSNGVYYWYRNDHLGMPQKVTTTVGAVAWAGIYDSFGNLQETTTTGFTNNLRFAGQYFDTETGLYYNLNWYYDPTTGRYLQTDPYGDGINLYAYVYNNPQGMIDPQGLCAVNYVGRILGTGFGEEATLWYAQKYNETGAWYYAVGGSIAALWTPETYVQTVITLATAPLVAAEITAAGADSAAAAARVVVKEVAEEVVGVPIPIRPKRLVAQKNLPVKYDGEFAAQQILGHKPVTPAGRQINAHAADRMVNPPKGRVPISASEVDNIIDTSNRIKKVTPHPEGTTITLQNTRMPGKPQVVVDADTGKRIITIINPKK